MTIREAAEKLKINANKLRTMCRRQELPAGVKAKKIPVIKESGKRKGKIARQYGPYRSDGTRNRKTQKEWDVKC